jgi:ankyrin repeat protein
MSNGQHTLDKNARARSIRTSNAAAASIDRLTKELWDRNPIQRQFPPGVGAHGTKKDDEFKADESSLTQLQGSSVESTALDLLRETTSTSSRAISSRLKEPEPEQYDYQGYDDQYRNPNPDGALSDAQLKRRFRLSAKVAWGKESELVDTAAEELRKAINAYDFDTCIRLIHKRQQKIDAQKALAEIDTKTTLPSSSPPKKIRTSPSSKRKQQQTPQPQRQRQHHVWPSLIHVTTSSGESPLTKACGERGSAASVELLLLAGINVEIQNRHGRTALMKAAASGQVDVVHILLKTDANVFVTDHAGRTALDWARLARKGRITKLIEAHVIRTIEKKRIERYRAERLVELRRVIERNHNARERVAEAVKGNDMDALWNILDEESGTVPLQAFQEAHEKLGSDASTDPYYTNVERAGWTPLTRAAANGNEPVVEKLLDEHATVDYEVRKLGHTALTWACVCGHVGVVSMLMMRGASLVKRTGTGRDTPLMVAVHHNRIIVVVKMVEQLSSWSLAERRRKVEQSAEARSDAERNELLSKDWVDYYRDALSLKDIKGESAIDIAKRLGFKRIQEIFAGALARVERRHAAAEKVRQAAIKVPCSLGCGHMGTQDRIHYHESRYCPRRPLPCTLDCGQEMRAELIEEHIERNCINRPVLCKNCYHGCMETMMWKDADVHARKFCKKRTVECRLECGITITFDKRVMHEQNECPLRVATCPIGCGRHDLKVLNLTSHVKNICPKRLVACQYKCGAVVKFEDMDEHIDKVCLQDCRWGCGCPRMAPVDRRRVHELHLCPLRIVPCHFGCGIAGLLAKDRDHHEAELCPERMVPCTYGCGESLRFKNLSFHLRGEDGDGGEHATCPSRPLHCLYNYIDKRLQIFGAVDELLPDPKAGRPGTAELRQLFSHKKQQQQLNDKMKKEQAGSADDDSTTDASGVPYSFIARVTRLRTQDMALEFMTSSGQRFFARLDELRYRLVDRGDWMCRVLREDERRDHHAFECVRRRVMCRNGCGQLMEYRQLDKHETHRCELLLSTCSNGCGHACASRDLEKHEKYECPMRKVVCDCQKYVMFNDLRRHVEDDCRAKLMYCRRGCGTQLPRYAIHDHLVGECNLRVVECALGCGIKKLWLKEKDRHERVECANRMVLCRLKCNIQIRYCDRKKHEKTQCENRDVVCPQGCGVIMPLWQTKDHMVYDCDARLLMCPQGCGVQVQWKNIDHHSEEECVNRYFMCFLGCGQSVLKSKQTFHETKECILRDFECPDGCGDTVVARDLPRHKKLCSRRQIPCGAESKACVRAFESWLTGDTAHGKGRLQVCEQHGSTALHWAAMTGDLDVIRMLLGFTGAQDIDLEALYDGTTPTARACIEGQLDAVKLLVEEGALLECETSRGYTPLICAVTRGWEEIVLFLAESGALIEYKNHLNKTALQWALELLGEQHPVYVKLSEIGTMQAKHRSLIQHITLDHFDQVYELCKEGAPHEFNALATMRNLIQEHTEKRKDSRNESKEYNMELEKLKPILDSKTANFTAKENAVKELLTEAEEIEKECNKMRATSDESIQVALFALRGLANSAIKTVADIRYPDEIQLMIMKAVCVMKGIKPKQKSDPRGSGAIIDDWWSSARRWIRKPDFKRSMSNEMQIRLKINDQQLNELQTKYLIKENDEIFNYNAGGEDGDGYPFIEAMATWVKAVEHYNKLERDFQPMQLKSEQLRIKYEKNMVLLTGEREEQERITSQWAMMSEAVADAHTIEEESTVVIERTEKNLRVAEMLSYRSLGGHSALTWSAMYGHTDIVEILLDHGAVLDYEDDHMHRAAELIQLMYRHRLYHKNRGTWNKLVAAKWQMKDIAHYFMLKSKCRAIKKMRKLVRTPLTEALYNGQADCVEALLNRGALMSHGTGIHPTAPLTGLFPSKQLNEANGAVFLNHGPVIHVMDDVLSPLQCCELGKIELGTFRVFMPPSAGDPTHFDEDRRLPTAGGWQDRNRFDETLDRIRVLQGRQNEKVRDWLKHRSGWLFAREEAEKLKQLDEECGEAVSALKFERVAELWDLGAGCEFENKYGHTALTMAAAVEALGVNNDGEVVTAISLFLDREFRRPNLDHETTKGHTALTTACKNGRHRVIETLLDRGAEINHICVDGMSALLHAAKNGQWDCVRLLLERGADPFQRDASGKTAADWAMERNLLGVVKIINNARAGFKGLAKANLGKALELYTCPLGCGKKMLKGDEMDDHEFNHCPKRYVECTLGCGIKEMWAQERVSHETNDCPKRLVPCPQKCSEMVNEDACLKHMQNVCIRRMVDCPSKCRARMEFKDVALHLERDCSKRKKPCTLGCGSSICSDEMRHHVTQICLLREVRCSLGCGKVMKAELAKHHEKKLCFNRVVDCRKGCGEKMKFGDRPTHEVHHCTIRVVACPDHCGEEMQSWEIEDHLKKDCINRPEPCPLKCGQKPQHKNLELHVKELCGFRIVECTQQCGIENLMKKDLFAHEKKNCVNRTVPCGYGCGQHIPKPVIGEHKENDCPKRIVQCPYCPRQVQAGENLDGLKHHVRFQCKKGKMFCRLGCGEIVVRGKSKGHENKHCAMRFVTCSLGCGAEMREKDRQVHETVQCLRRMGGGKNQGHGSGSGKKNLGKKYGNQKKTKTTSPENNDNDVASLPTIESMRTHNLKEERKKLRGQNPATQKAIDSGSRTGTPVGTRTVPNTPAKGRYRGESRQSLPGI